MKPLRSQPHKPVSYRDSAGNAYRVEKASNGMHICVRTNAGGNRKGFKTVGASHSAATLQRLLDDVAKSNGWEALP